MPSGYVFGSAGPFYNDLPMKGSQPDISGTTYYVDYNCGSNANHGKSWEKPFKTLENAIAVSNANIANISKDAKRNTIYLVGYPAGVNLTVFPTKCDVIGVGSNGAHHMATIIGYHAPNVRNTVSTRFFNIYFENSSVQNNVITLNSTMLGCEFHGCIIDGGSSPQNGLSVTSSPYLSLVSCKILGTYLNAGIYFGIGELARVNISNCELTGSDKYGISTESGTSAYAGAYVVGNRIKSVDKCINDVSGKMYIINNRLFTSNAKGTAGNGAITCSPALAQDNRITCSNLTNAVYPAQGAL